MIRALCVCVCMCVCVCVCVSPSTELSRSTLLSVNSSSCKNACILLIDTIAFEEINKKHYITNKLGPFSRYNFKSVS